MQGQNEMKKMVGRMKEKKKREDICLEMVSIIELCSTICKYFITLKMLRVKIPSQSLMIMVNELLTFFPLLAFRRQRLLRTRVPIQETYQDRNTL